MPALPQAHTLGWLLHATLHAIDLPHSMPQPLQYSAQHSACPPSATMLLCLPSLSNNVALPALLRQQCCSGCSRATIINPSWVIGVCWAQVALLSSAEPGCAMKGGMKPRQVPGMI